MCRFSLHFRGQKSLENRHGKRKAETHQIVRRGARVERRAVIHDALDVVDGRLRELLEQRRRRAVVDDLVPLVAEHAGERDARLPARPHGRAAPRAVRAEARAVEDDGVDALRVGGEHGARERVLRHRAPGVDGPRVAERARPLARRVELLQRLRLLVDDHGPRVALREAHGPVGLVRAPEIQVQSPGPPALEGLALLVGPVLVVAHGHVGPGAREDVVRGRGVREIRAGAVVDVVAVPLQEADRRELRPKGRVHAPVVARDHGRVQAPLEGSFRRVARVRQVHEVLVEGLVQKGVREGAVGRVAAVAVVRVPREVRGLEREVAALPRPHDEERERRARLAEPEAVAERVLPAGAVGVGQRPIRRQGRVAARDGVLQVDGLGRRVRAPADGLVLEDHAREVEARRRVRRDREGGADGPRPAVVERRRPLLEARRLRGGQRRRGGPQRELADAPRALAAVVAEAEGVDAPQPLAGVDLHLEVDGLAGQGRRHRDIAAHGGTAGAVHIPVVRRAAGQQVLRDDVVRCSSDGAEQRCGAPNRSSL